MQNGVEGYTMSIFDWLLKKDYHLLLVLLLFVEGIIPYGFGDVTRVPIYVNAKVTKIGMYCIRLQTFLRLNAD